MSWNLATSFIVYWTYPFLVTNLSFSFLSTNILIPNDVAAPHYNHFLDLKKYFFITLLGSHVEVNKFCSHTMAPAFGKFKSTICCYRVIYTVICSSSGIKSALCSGVRFALHRKPFNGLLPIVEAQMKPFFSKPSHFVFQYLSLPFSRTKHPLLATFKFSKKLRKCPSPCPQTLHLIRYILTIGVWFLLQFAVAVRFGIRFALEVWIRVRSAVHKKPFNGLLPFAQAQMKPLLAKPSCFVFQYFSFPFSNAKTLFLCQFLIFPKMTKTTFVMSSNPATSCVIYLVNSFFVVHLSFSFLSTDILTHDVVAMLLYNHWPGLKKIIFITLWGPHNEVGEFESLDLLSQSH